MLNSKVGDMKRFVQRLLLFVVFLIGLDMISGLVFKALTQNAKGGDTARNEYIANKVDAPMLIFGSSRAIHHYVPQIFRDSLGMECYNCGQDGMGIILFYGRYKMITERYVPKVIVYDVLPSFDFEAGDDYSYLGWLKPYYDKEGIDSIFWKIAPNERYKMCSQMYRYNGKILQMLIDNIKNIHEDNNGYRPAYGTMRYEPQKQTDVVSKDLDSLKLYFWEKFIQDCHKKGTRLILALSPFYGESNSFHTVYPTIYHLAKRYHIPIINHYDDKKIICRKDLFMDSFHMNYLGAEIYSKEIVDELHRIISHKDNEK